MQNDAGDAAFPFRSGNASRTVVVVDDEPENLLTYAEILEDLGLGVFACQDARAALALIRSGERVDLVITDYRMPLMDGLEFITELRRHLPVVPVIMVTAGGSIETYLKTFSLGAFEYINKPVSKEEFERIVRAALVGHGGGPADTGN